MLAWMRHSSSGNAATALRPPFQDTALGLVLRGLRAEIATRWALGQPERVAFGQAPALDVSPEAAT